MVKIVVKVEVVPYNEDWPRKYALEANVIRNIVLDELITITHVGSTAVNPDIAREYGELKLSLAKKYPDNIKQYKKGKEAFTKEIQTRALKWYRHKDVEQI